MTTPEAMKRCFSCSTDLPHSSFQKNRGTKTGLHAYCRACTSVKNKAWVAANREKQALSCANWYANNRARARAKANAWHYKNYYGMTQAEVAALLAQQDGKCPICQRVLNMTGRKGHDMPVVDHCHATNKVRGVLCTQCNLAIGFLQDNTTILQAAISYLTDSVR